MDQGGKSKNLVALAGMVVILAGVGFYIYSQYAKQQNEQSKLNSIVKTDVDPDAIRARRVRRDQTTQAAQKFIPLLRAAKEGAAKEAAAKEGAQEPVVDQKSPFGAPPKKAEGPAEGGAAPAEAPVAPATSN